MAGATKSIDPASITDDEKAYMMKTLIERRKGGENVFIPGQNDRGGVSSKGKSLPNAINDMDNLSYFSTWDYQSKSLDPRVASAYMEKSLYDCGYQSKKMEFNSFGDFIQQGYACKGLDQDFRAKYRAPFEKIDPTLFRARGMSTLVGSDGGFLLQPEFAPTIQQLTFENTLPAVVNNISFSGPLYRITKSKDTNRADGYRNGGVVSSWINEGGTIDSSKLGLDYTELRMKKLAVVVFVTEELMSDTPTAIESYIRNAVRSEFNFQLSRAYMWGRGGVEPRGFARSAAALQVDKRDAQSADTLLTGNLLDMEARLFEQPGSKPLWMYHRSCTPQIGEMNIGNFPVSINIGGIHTAPQTQLRGIPAHKTEFAAQLGDAGDIWLIDPSMYYTMTRANIREDVSTHVEFLTDQSAIRFIFGVDGAPLYDKPVTPWQAGATAPDTQSSYVYLEAR